MRRLLENLTLATMQPGGAPYGLIENAKIFLYEDYIVWAGAAEHMPDEAEGSPLTDLGGRLVTPALIDCHTHLVHGGNRAREFEMRLTGASYQEIAKSGGGILSTMRATREATEAELVAGALPRLDALIAEGVATVEIKSGYGLTIEDEMKMLHAARALGEYRNVTIVTSWLAAHALPPEYAGDPDRYIDEICIPGLEEAAMEGLVDAVDGFCEGIAFTPAQIARVFDAAQALGLPVKLHAEQLSDLGGAAMAAERGALSVDHLEYLGAEGIAAMAEHDTVATLLPGAYYTLRETQAPPVQALRDADIPIAIATDANPGSSPMCSVLLAMNMAATLFRLTPEETLAGVTRNAAKALGLKDRGTVALGQRADLAVWNVAHPSELAYRIGYNPLDRVIRGGVG